MIPTIEQLISQIKSGRSRITTPELDLLITNGKRIALEIDYTPELAEHVCKHWSKENYRPFVKDNGEKLRRKLESGRWDDFKDYITFATVGVVEGRHRTYAVKMSGVTIYKQAMEFGVPKEQEISMGTAMPRTYGNYNTYFGKSHSNNDVATVKVLHYEAVNKRGGQKSLDFHEIDQLIDVTYKEGRAYAKKHTHPFKPAYLNAVIWAASYYPEYRVRLDEGMEILRTGEGAIGAKDHAMIVLRDHLNVAKSGRRPSEAEYRFIQSCFDAFLKGRKHPYKNLPPGIILFPLRTDANGKIHADKLRKAKVDKEVIEFQKKGK